MNIIFEIFSLSLALFLLMDSIGNIPLFVAILRHFDPDTQKKIIRRELLIALGIIVIFYFLGNFLLDLIQVRQHTVFIAGGIILFLISIRMVFPKEFTEKELKSSSAHIEHPLVVPLAIPLVAGPAVLASIMIYSEQESIYVVLPSIGIAWLISTFVLYNAVNLKKILGSRGLLACEKLMGLILIMISIQMFLEGITLYISELTA